MAVRSGKKAEIHPVRGGSVTPEFNLQGPVSKGIFYELVTTPGERVEVLTDTEVRIIRHVSPNADIRLQVVHQFGLEADSLLSLTRHANVTADIHLAISRTMEITADLALSIRRSPNIPKQIPRPTEPALEFLGKGLRFPFTFQRRSGGAQISTATSSDHAHIHESIRQILGTKKGERFMRPEFGTRLHEMIFEQNDRLLYGLIRHEVIEALEEWEPRIIITDVIVGPDEADDHLVLVNIGYRLISSQAEGNLVYPFWRELE